MEVESDDDRAALLDDFGIDIEIGGRTIRVIFDNGFEDANGMWVEVPVLTARTIDWEDVDRGDTLYIGNDAYTMVEPHPDGQGMSQIILQKT